MLFIIIQHSTLLYEPENVTSPVPLAKGRWGQNKQHFCKCLSHTQEKEKKGERGKRKFSPQSQKNIMKNITALR